MVSLSVGISVCVGHFVSPANTADPTEMPLGECGGGLTRLLLYLGSNNTQFACHVEI